MVVRRRPASGLVVLLVVAAIAVGCGESEAETAHEEVPWSYAGDAGPDRWGELSPDYGSCSEGREQSPVDLVDASDGATAPLVFRYRSSPGTVTDNGHAVAVELDDGGGIELDGETQTLAGFHFHAPSEHAVRGRAFPAELHLVHATSEGELAVVGVLLREGERNEALADTLTDVPSGEGETRELAEPVDQR